jgi:hypothetical protein
MSDKLLEGLKGHPDWISKWERRYGQNHVKATTDADAGINLLEPALSSVWKTTLVCL